MNVLVTLKISLFILCMCWGEGDKAVCHAMYVEVKGQCWVLIPLSTLFEMRSFLFTIAYNRLIGPKAVDNSFVLASRLPEEG